MFMLQRRTLAQHVLVASVCHCTCVYLCVCVYLSVPGLAAHDVSIQSGDPWTNHWEAVQADVFVAIRTSIELCEMISIYLGYL